MHRDPRHLQRLQRGAQHLHQLGPRATAELLAELADQAGCWPAMLATLAAYQQRLTPALVRAAGGDGFPPKPIRHVA